MVQNLNVSMGWFWYKHTPLKQKYSSSENSKVWIDQQARPGIPEVMKRNPISQEGQQLNKNNSCGEDCDGLTEIGCLAQNSLDLETSGDSIDNEHRLMSSSTNFYIPCPCHHCPSSFVSSYTDNKANQSVFDETNSTLSER